MISAASVSLAGVRPMMAWNWALWAGFQLSLKAISVNVPEAVMRSSVSTASLIGSGPSLSARMAKVPDSSMMKPAIMPRASTGPLVEMLRRLVSVGLAGGWGSLSSLSSLRNMSLNALVSSPTRSLAKES